MTAGLQKIWKNFLGVLVFATFIIIAMLLLGDASAMMEAFIQADTSYIVLAGIFSLGVYTGRFLKWQIFLRQLRLTVPWRISLRIFLCGIAMGITPGKVGEVLKSYLLSMETGIEFSRTAPTIVAERLTGVLGCFILSITAFIFLGDWTFYRIMSAALIFLFIFLLAAAFRSVAFARCFKHLIAKTPFINRWQETLLILYESLTEILSAKILLVCIGVSIGYWFMECMVFFCIIKAFGMEITMENAIFSLTALSLGSGITMLPGSIGALEGGMMGMLVYHGAAMSTAGCITLLHRFFAMWLYVGIGAFMLICSYKRIL